MFPLIIFECIFDEISRVDSLSSMSIDGEVITR